MRPDRPMMGGMDWDPTGASKSSLGNPALDSRYFFRSSPKGAFGFAAGMGRMPVPGLPAPHVNPAFFGAQAFNALQAQE